MKFKEIIGGNESTIKEKFPWLLEADIENAVVDVSMTYLVWKNGIWKGGTWESGTWEGGAWKNGTWKDGLWKRGIWEDGLWEDGTWKRGNMWSNILQKYIRIKGFEDGKFIEVKLNI